MKVIVDTNTCEANHRSSTYNACHYHSITITITITTTITITITIINTMKREKQARNWARLLVQGYSMVVHNQERH